MKKTISNPENFRANVRNEFMRVFVHCCYGEEPPVVVTAPLATTCWNCEISVFNHAIRQAECRKVIKKWENPGFSQLYIEKLRTVIWNMRANATLRKRLLDGTISAEKIAAMTHQEYDPQQWAVFIEEKRKKDLAKAKVHVEASTDKFTCSRCKSKKCTYYELQTRSADEPVTVFITCLECDKRWKT